MRTITEVEKTIIQKVREMAPEKANEVLDFVEFISFKDKHRLMLQAQQDVISKYWNNPRLDIYND